MRVVMSHAQLWANELLYQPAKYNGQIGAVMAYVGAINKLNTFGSSVRTPRE
ncbi:hypothetical protein GWQ22_12795 [Aeromonas sp. 1HA1]|nr:hypothetical protein [Aeromonas sp. 1HA1]